MELLHSNVIGDSGIPFVILHGFLGNGDNWKTLGKRFSALGYQVHSLDQRNHGKSFHSNDFNYQVLVEDVVHYCNQYKLEHIILLGHSMGGKVAMHIAACYPKLVDKLIIADIAPRFYPLHHQTILEGLLAIDFDEVNTRQMAEVILDKYVQDRGTRQFLLKNLYWQAPSKLGWRMNLHVLINNIDEIGKALPEMYSINCPSLFLKGSRSDYINQTDELMIINQFHRAQIQTISNAGHWLHAENPEAFFQAVVTFLGK